MGDGMGLLDHPHSVTGKCAFDKVEQVVMGNRLPGGGTSGHGDPVKFLAGYLVGSAVEDQIAFMHQRFLS
jgi:hypothetical protein